MTPEALQRVERYQQTVERLESQTVQRLNQAIDRSYQELERSFLAQYPTIASNGSLIPLQRRAVLLSDLGELMAVIRPSDRLRYQQELEQALVRASQLGEQMGEELMRAIAPNSTTRVFASIPIEALAAQAKDGVRRLYRHGETFRDRASSIIEQGLIQGWGAQRSARAIRQQLGVTKGQAERIARTEMLSALNDGAQDRYNQAGVEGVQWCATSRDVCPICVARNMRVYPTGRVRVPAHVACRCVLIPWRREWQEMELTDDGFSAEYRADRMAELRSAGAVPNYGLSPFERSSGLDKPIEPMWTP